MLKRLHLKIKEFKIKEIMTNDIYYFSGQVILALARDMARKQMEKIISIASLTDKKVLKQSVAWGLFSQLIMSHMVVFHLSSGDLF
jgi:hypothetical protein